MCEHVFEFVIPSSEVAEARRDAMEYLRRNSEAEWEVGARLILHSSGRYVLRLMQIDPADGRSGRITYRWQLTGLARNSHLKLYSAA
ncbi:unnamed protein product [Gemmata massiliana]|uniref:Uncharacterized protein n=1 Tax=Gemmata massiliana TaxID=1210884 RepID=A0A6P2CRP4_9BACT|nr:hypothetical protein [Gemmata massiliana]VTR91589.1 unnamed protein product [Gemmata massiliana]